MVNTPLSDIQRKYYHAILHKQLQDVLSPIAQKQLKAKGTSLQNQLMQLRKVCNHPYLLEWPTDVQGHEIIDENIVKSAGKLQLLDRYVIHLFTFLCMKIITSVEVRGTQSSHFLTND